MHLPSPITHEDVCEGVSALNRPSGGVIVHQEPDAPRTMDDVDRAIVGMLREDGRTTSRAIATSVGVTEASVTGRIRTLLSRQTIAITTVFDWEKVGYRQDLWLRVKADGDPDDLGHTLAGIKGVHGVLRLLGPEDLLVHVLLPEPGDVAGFVSSRLAGVVGLGAVDTAVGLKVLKYAITLAKLPVETSHFDFPDPALDLDALDHATLTALARDGRQSNRQIARDLGVNEGTIRSRIRRLEETGILRICGQVNSLLTGPSVTRAVSAVEVDVTRAESIGRAAAELPGVSMVATVTGRHPLLLMGGYEHHPQMVETLRRLRALPGVRGVQNSLVSEVVAIDYHLARFVDHTVPNG
jgi:Lrp/AsnC family transcriptional regulator for asnA, asnC and gidA